jgi:hypothetical protein
MVNKPTRHEAGRNSKKGRKRSTGAPSQRYRQRENVISEVESIKNSAIRETCINKGENIDAGLPATQGEHESISILFPRCQRRNTKMSPPRKSVGL